jgi:MFS family permease
MNPSEPRATEPLLRYQPAEVEESLTEGDFHPARPGSARAALAHRAFRVVWLGQLGSSVGSWMQTFVIGIFMDRLTGQGTWVGIAMFAQMVPLLVFTIPGGVIADRFDRRRLLITLQSMQLVLATALGLLAIVDKTPSKLAVIALVFGGGVCNSLNAPAYSATLPALVGREDLAGAISLNSAAINGSRVLGPVLGGLLYPIVGAGWIYLLNALTFVFVIGALLQIRLPAFPRSTTAGLGQLLVGFRAARADRVLSRILVSLALFSLFALPFISLWSTIMRVHLGLRTAGSIGLMYAVFGFGALVGSLAVASHYLAQQPKERLTRVGFAGFSVMMALIAVTAHPAVAFPAFFLLGAFYFGTTTALLTILQSRVDDAIRGRVMSLWFMAFGGTVALCGPIFGPLLDATGPRLVLGIGAATAAGLAWWCDLGSLQPRP